MTLRLLFTTMILFCLSQVAVADELWELYTKSLSTSPEMRVLAHRYKAKADDYLAAKRSRWTQLTLTTNYQRILPTLVNEYNFTDFGLTDAIDIFGKDRYRIKGLRQEAKASALFVERGKRGLFLKLAKAYFDYLYANQLVLIAQEDFVWAQKELTVAKQRYKAGGGAYLDVLRLKGTLAKAQSCFLAAQAQRSIVASRLKLICGFSPKIKASLKETLTFPELNLKELENQTIHLAPEIKAWRLKAKAERSMLQAIKREWIPTLTLGVGYQINQEPAGNGNQWDFMVGLSSHLFDLGRKKKLLSHQEKYLSLLAQARAQELTLRDFVRRNYYNYIAAKQKLLTYKNALKDLEDVVNRLHQGYETGGVDLNTLLLTHQNLLQLKKAYFSALSYTHYYFTVLQAISSPRLYAEVQP